MILGGGGGGGGGGHRGGRWSDTISGKGLELHMKINYDKSVSK